MITSIHIKQSSHFLVKLRFGGALRQEPIALEHRPQLDPPKAWTITSSQVGSPPVICEVEIWTVFGERTAVRFTTTLETQPFLRIHADESGLTIWGPTPPAVNQKPDSFASTPPSQLQFRRPRPGRNRR